MNSIFDRDKLRPIKFKGNNYPDYLLPGLTLLLIIVFWFILISLIKKSPPEASNNMDCSPGQCATNLFTGAKRCPQTDSGVVSSVLGLEVCNSRFTCENASTPFAVKSDGSTDINGVCEDGVTCRCVQKPQCGRHVTSVFSTRNGNPYQGLDNQRIVFQQLNSFQDIAGNFTIERPYTYNSSINEFCAVPMRWMNERRLYPGKCLTGTLAFVPDNPDDFDINNTPVSCVIGEDCPSNKTSVWDPRVGKVVCK